MKFVDGNATVKILILGPNRLATLNETRQLRPHLGGNSNVVLGQDADMLA